MPKEDTFEYVNERINKIAEQVDAIDQACRHELTGIDIRLRSLEYTIREYLLEVRAGARVAVDALERKQADQVDKEEAEFGEGKYFSDGVPHRYKNT